MRSVGGLLALGLFLLLLAGLLYVYPPSASVPLRRLLLVSEATPVWHTLSIR